MSNPGIGIALGSGAARGWAHIGVLRALEERGIRPGVVCGASIGSLVAAACASGQLDTLEDWVRGLSRMDVVRLLDTGFRGGFMTGTRVMTAVGTQLEDKDIETLPVRFGAVATDLQTGREVWLRSGPMLSAVRASSGLPGLFSPIQHGGRWLIDGGVVNPVPVSMCHALGADVVIAVNLNADLVRRRSQRPPPKPAKKKEEKQQDEASVFGRFAGAVSDLFKGDSDPSAEEPGIFDVVGASINIMQERITRSRMAGEPPELTISPKVGDFQLMDFHRADEAIEAGRQAVEAVEDQLERMGPGAQHPPNPG
ncbi:MAG: patatin-like phospholipase RssA [Pseudomonadota bacterium]